MQLGTKVHCSQITGDYITENCEEIEGRVTKKLSQDFSRTENRILGALSRLDDVLLNPLLQGHSGTTRKTSWNAYGINQRMNEDDSQKDLRPEAGLLQSQTTRNSGPEDGHGRSEKKNSRAVFPEGLGIIFLSVLFVSRLCRFTLTVSTYRNRTIHIK